MHNGAMEGGAVRSQGKWSYKSCVTPHKFWELCVLLTNEPSLRPLGGVLDEIRHGQGTTAVGFGGGFKDKVSGVGV